MRVVVFSDSHGKYAVLEEIVRSQPQADLFLHLGDGLEEFGRLRARFPDKRMRGVAGNCDWSTLGEKTGEVNCMGKTIFFTHGHSCGVKGGLDRLLEAARSAGAHIALYGHTHVAQTHYEDGLYVMNPGSAAYPRDGSPSYGVIDITDAGIVTHIVSVNRRARP